MNRHFAKVQLNALQSVAILLCGGLPIVLRVTKRPRQAAEFRKSVSLRFANINNFA
jgi:hypothetical protein